MTALNFDPAQTKAFLEALSDEWETEHFAWQPVDDDKTRKIISKVENNTLENIAGFLETKNRGGHAIFVTINKTDGFGRLAKNIVTIRAIWCDWDRVDQPVPAWPIPPHLEVNTSPGKYQFIWCCETLSSETFKQAMARMIELGSDPGAKDVSRVLRVPGFFHQKRANGEAAAPYLVRITRKNDIPRYTNAEIAAAFPANGKTKTKPNGHGDSTLTPAEEARVRDALTWISAECHRNVWRNIGMALHTVGARSIWDDWSKTCPEAFDKADQDAAWNSFKDDREDGIKLGTIYHLAQDSGWRPREPDSEPPPIGEAVGDDTRPHEKAPYPDAPITPIMRLLDERLSTDEPEPPMRNIMGQMATVRVRKPRHQSLHELVPEGSETRLEPPVMPLLTEHDETSLAILIERYINFEKVIKTKKGETRTPVSLAMPFVRHYHRYADSILPVVHSIAQMPLVSPSGRLAASQGLDRDIGIIFRIDPKLAGMLPRPGSVTREDVAAAMKFLLDDWLCDVKPATVASKCVLIAMVLTILERSVLVSGRPGFFITAAKRGGGKTTAAHTVSVAALGVHAMAAAWSPAEEERRKAMLAYLSEGLPFLCFDNIASGAAISSPTIEAMLTSGEVSDRVLGVSKTLHVAASTIVCFTGNNIAPCGDLSSRCLVARIDVDRPDPEHREFKHPFPLDWTAATRGKILAALYTVMLGDPEIGKPLDSATPHTRFREWEMIVGRPVEHGAKQIGEDVSFAEMLTETEASDENAIVHVEVLLALSRQWPGGKPFEAKDVVECFRFPSDAPPDDIALVRDYFDPYAKGEAISSKKVGQGLKVLKDAPFLVDGGTIKLTSGDNSHAKIRVYKITREYSSQ